MPEDGPVFLKNYQDWIVSRASAPDTWRQVSEPFLRIDEDPNHGWFREQFDLMRTPPRSRYEFITQLHNEYLRIKSKDPEKAKWMNVRWTGTLPYAAIEGYERMKSSFRIYRSLKSGNKDTKNIELDLAFYMGWLGHYTGDASMPLHVSVHADGWKGPNPKGYTTDRRIHGRVETAFVDMIEFSSSDVSAYVKKPQLLDDAFEAILKTLDESSASVEEIYQMDKEGLWADKTSTRARTLILKQIAAGAQLLRDLVYTAWIESAKPAESRRLSAAENPIDPAHPGYNPETGSAPAPRNQPGKP